MSDHEDAVDMVVSDADTDENIYPVVDTDDDDDDDDHQEAIRGAQSLLRFSNYMRQAFPENGFRTENVEAVASSSAVNEATSDESTQPELEAAKESKDEPDVVPEASANRERSAETSVDDDGQMCTICFEPWTSSSDHRLVSLRCGHLFGRSCIMKWLKGQGSRCPQCNARARKSEIRAIYARTLKVLDTSERDRALRELEKEVELRRKSEMECVQMRLKYSMAMQECERLKKQLMETQMLLNETRFSGKCTDKLTQSSKVFTPAFALVKNTDLRGGGCRIMDCSDLLGMLVVSQPSTNPLFPGYGLKKISLPDMRLSEYLCLHQKPIKDISFHNHDGLVLTSSLDKTVKLTNFLSNTVVQTYNLDCDVWSCVWDLDDPCYFFAGVRTGVVYVFDIRMTDQHVCELPTFGQISPVVSLQYLRREPAAKHSKCGPIVGQLSSCCFCEKVTPTSYKVNPLPLEGKFTSLDCESTTSHLLASFRPSQKHPRVTHTLCELCFEDNSLSCNLVQAMVGGSSQAQLTRSKLLAHPADENSVLVCAGDEESKAALVWDGSTGELLDSLNADSPILDVTSFHHQHKSLLTTLTEKNLRVYEWMRD